MGRGNETEGSGKARERKGGIGRGKRAKATARRSLGS